MAKIVPILNAFARQQMRLQQQQDSKAATQLPKEHLISQMRRCGSTPRPNPFTKMSSRVDTKVERCPEPRAPLPSRDRPTVE